MKPLEPHIQEGRKRSERNQRARRLAEGRLAAEGAPRDRGYGGADGADEERHDQQEAERHDAGAGDHVGAPVACEAAAFRFRSVPYGIERIFELSDDAEGGDAQQHDAERGRDAAASTEEAPLRIASTACAPVGPSRSRNCALREPRAASSPNNRPAMEMTPRRSGPRRRPNSRPGLRRGAHFDGATNFQ